MPTRPTAARAAREDTPGSPPVRLTSPILIERERERGLLVEVALEPPALVIVEGEAGVGKTRLVQEVLSQPELRSHRRLVGGCHPLREPFPLGPVVEALRHVRLPRRALNPVTGTLRPLLPELRESLPAEPRARGDPRAQRHQLLRAVRELLDVLGPTVLVLEDLHWLDEATEEFLGFLASGLPEGLSLVLTYRREDVPDSSSVLRLAARPPAGARVARVTLPPLTEQGVGRLVGAILKEEEVSGEFASYLHERTAGLPFAVEEVLGLLRDRGDLVLEGDRWVRRTLPELGVPAAIRDSVVARLGRLTSEAMKVVRAAAVLGIPEEEALLARVAGLSVDRTARALARALASAVLHDEGDARYGFRHVLAQQAVYEAIPRPERRQIHRRAARALRAEGASPALLVRHYRDAGQEREWIRAAEATADLALSAGDDRTASELLREVFEEAHLPGATRARLAAKLGRAALHGLDHEAASVILRRILEDDLPTSLRGELRLHFAWLLAQGGDASSSYMEKVRAVGDLGKRPDLAARAMASLAFPAVVEGDLDEHLRWLDGAVRTAARSGDAVAQAGVLVDRATVLLTIGDSEGWKAAMALPEDAGSREANRQLVRGFLNLAQAAFHIGHYRRAEAFVSKGLARSRELDYERTVGLLETTDTLLRWVTGRWEGLEERARELVEETADVPHASLDAHLVLGMLLAARGRTEEAASALAEIVPLARRSGSLPILAAGVGGLIRLRLGEGDVSSAGRLATEAMDLIARKRVWPWAGDLAPAAVEARLATGGEAEELVALFEEGLEGRDAPAAAAALLDCRARLAEASGELRAASRLFASAERAWSDLPRPHAAAASAEAAGRNLVECGEESGAEQLRTALGIFTNLGATRDVNRVRRTLRRHGIGLPHRGGRRGYGDRLSPREEEVARLVAEGRTNREIGAILFLSPWTVSQHASNAVRKLGLRSRDDLGPALRAREAKIPSP